MIDGVAAEVSSRVTRVLVRDNQEVNAGDVLFEIDSEQYRIAADRARSDLETMRRQIGAGTAGIDSARASLRAAIANKVKARQDSKRLERLYREDARARSRCGGWKSRVPPTSRRKVRSRRRVPKSSAHGSSKAASKRRMRSCAAPRPRSRRRSSI